ncbi:universal stress protein YxiE-like isoform X2 [Littorina saxatilis]|uniref:universal stress protein YxiE-like isoform X2 n=1 Tax=Littorina saxatilis TaxID=31220 RepID=UPI0038B578A1
MCFSNIFRRMHYLCEPDYLKHVHREGNTVKIVHCPEYWANVRPMEGPSLLRMPSIAPLVISVPTGPTPARLNELIAETNANTAAIADKVKTTLAAAGVTGEFVKLEGKEPWQEICKAADSLGANLIVLGTRGVGTIKRTLLGSCSDSVMHHAHCPVLVCKHNA